MKNTTTKPDKTVKKLNTKSSRYGIAISGVLTFLMVFFQNCSQAGKIVVANDDARETTSVSVDPQPADDRQQAPPDLTVCNGVSCSLAPITQKVAVTTILLALGDEVDDQLVVAGGSAQLIAESVIRYTTPVSQPHILVVHDRGSGGESAYDTQYVMKVLLSRYNPNFIEEPIGGITDKDLEGYDLVWFNNPGNPMTMKKSMETLVAYKGGVVLQGDDLSWGRDFSMEKLTHVKNIDNGTDVRCAGGSTPSYHMDNNQGQQYRVTLDPEKMPTPNSESLNFKYGNDIDLVSVAGTDVEILATAQGGPDECGDNRATIFRYFKE